ncbi:hypothetical protein BDR03DRAFT_971251 [Suillus americanus]|nr:hypothetical protein BDR03DRAFT_971251 [Suillus americanus]
MRSKLVLPCLLPVLEQANENHEYKGIKTTGSDSESDDSYYGELMAKMNESNANIWFDAPLRIVFKTASHA